MKKARLHNFVFAIVDTKPTVDAEKKSAYKYEWLAPFLDFLETDIPNDLPYPSDVPDMKLMFDYKLELQTREQRYNSIGMDAILDVDAFIQKMNDMVCEWLDHKKWYKETTYQLREKYVRQLLSKENEENVSNPHQTTLDSLKSKLQTNNTF
jgi:hypothetical protein